VPEVSILITAPESAEVGEKVPVSVKVTNLMEDSYYLGTELSVNAVLILSTSEFIPGGSSKTYDMFFYMPEVPALLVAVVKYQVAGLWVPIGSASKTVTLAKGELLIGLAWWEGKDGWNEILETNTWPVNTAIITTWKVKNTGNESAVFKTRLLPFGVEGEAWLTPGATFIFEQSAISLSLGTHHFTLEILADDEVVAEYPFQVVVSEPRVSWLPWAIGAGVLGLGTVALLAAKKKK